MLKALLIVINCFFLMHCDETQRKYSEKFRLHNAMTPTEFEFYFQTNDVDFVPDYDVVYLPDGDSSMPEYSKNSNEQESVHYTFSAFQREINLKLHRNKNIFGKSFETFIHDSNGIRFLNETPSNCHFLHQDDSLIAALSICSPKTVQGILLLENSTYEIHPLTPNLRRLVKRQIGKGNNENFDNKKIPHIIKKAYFQNDFSVDDLFPTAGNVWNVNQAINSMNSEKQVVNTSGNYFYSQLSPMSLEIALFFDEAAYKIFAPYFGYNDKKLLNMLLAYVNGVQALYHHPSIGTTLDLVLVRIDIMKKQPEKLPHFNGERSQLLDSFCEYQATINPQGDDNPRHWDMSLYLSGLDFHAYENGRKSSVTMGLATVGGVCLDKYACVIAEFGTSNVFGKPYPSAGFTSVYIAAHEIGHNLGMHHDSTGNNCPKDGYIMSSSRGTNGETQWSTCSAEVMSHLSSVKCLKDIPAKPDKFRDHSRFLEIPGKIYTAKKQCEILLRDSDAFVAPNQQPSQICSSLQCKTPHRSGYYFAGPALDGTACDTTGKHCYGGYCSTKPLPKPVKVQPGGWSQWKKTKCSSGCIKNSKGIQLSNRECNNPIPLNTDQGCVGSNRNFNFCEDFQICNRATFRLTPIEFASKKCKEFATVLPELDASGVGLQSSHEADRVWSSCAIYCKRQDSAVFYTPRIELNDLKISPYFPDGTWCHRDATGLDYYCIQHHCLPENFQFTKVKVPQLDDIPFAQNARPALNNNQKYQQLTLPEDVKNYFSVDSNGKQLNTNIKSVDWKPLIHVEDWETKDYVELPTIEKRFNTLVKDIHDFDFL